MPLSTIIDVIERLVMERAEPNRFKGHLARLRDQADALEAAAQRPARKATLRQLEAQIERLQAESKANKSNAEQNTKAEIAKAQKRSKAQIAKVKDEAQAETMALEKAAKAIIGDLQTELKEAHIEIQRLRALLAVAESRPAKQQTASAIKRPTKIEDNVLRVILNHEPLTTDELKEALRELGLGDATDAIRALDKRKFISARSEMRGTRSELRWHLTPMGDDYADREKLK